MALAKLSSLHLGYNVPGEEPASITKLRGVLQDLKDANKSFPDAMAKFMMLPKINNRNYSHNVNSLIVSCDAFEACVTRCWINAIFEATKLSSAPYVELSAVICHMQYHLIDV